MIHTADYHTHTIYSHGKGDIIDNVRAAKDIGLKTIGITDHGFNHPTYGVSRRDIPKMKSLCEQAENETCVRVLLGVEANILGVDGKTDVKESDYDSLDIYLCGIHRFVMYDKFSEWFKLLGSNFFTRKFRKEIPQSLIDRNTKVYINAIKNNPIDILTHPGYLVFANAKEVAKCCSDYGTYFEINSKKEHLSDEEWADVLTTDVRFVIDSDAHKPSNVGNFSLADGVITRVGIPEDRIYNINGREPLDFRFAEYKKRK